VDHTVTHGNFHEMFSVFCSVPVCVFCFWGYCKGRGQIQGTWEMSRAGCMM